MPSHPIDFEIFGGSVSTPQMKEIFSEEKTLKRWLQIEVVLAQVQGEFGIIPKEAADEIADKAKLENIDLKKVRENYLQTRHSLMPLLKVFKNICDGETGEYVHYGATTQDVIDTAEILDLKEAVNIFYKNLLEIETILLKLAEKHAATPIIGRTHGQQALPTTFGFKVAVWAEEARRHINRLKEVPQRLFVGQLSGGVGTFAALGEKAQEVSAEVMRRLGLKMPPISWHSSRDNIAEIVCQFAMICSTMGKIANEIYQLQKTEMGELAESAGEKSIGSSTMPHKSNPVRCQRVISLSKQVRYHSALVIECMAAEHERDVRNLTAEWGAVPEAAIYTGAVLNHMIFILGGLIVCPEKMMANLHIQGDMIQTEWLLFKLAPVLGKMRAHDKLHDLAAAVKKSKISLKSAIAGDKELMAHLTAGDLDFLDKPEKYLGLAEKNVGQVIEHIFKERLQDPQELSVV